MPEDPAARARQMARIRSKNTKIELLVRKMLFAQGLRYRIHVHSLPGSPDIVLPKYRAVVFVNGCFWHGHDCHLYREPKTRAQFWSDKIVRNQERDRSSLARLEAENWRVAVVWECALRGHSEAHQREVGRVLAAWIRSTASYSEISGPAASEVKGV